MLRWSHRCWNAVLGRNIIGPWCWKWFYTSKNPLNYWFYYCTSCLGPLRGRALVLRYQLHPPPPPLLGPAEAHPSFRPWIRNRRNVNWKLLVKECDEQIYHQSASHMEDPITYSWMIGPLRPQHLTLVAKMVCHGVPSCSNVPGDLLDSQILLTMQ